LSGFLDTNPVNLFQRVRDTTEAEEVSISALLNELLDRVISQDKSLIFILDGFDLFCRKNQTFLYNIFDLTQKCTRIAVIGMTPRLDCLELLEKRVKSRMSQTVIHLNSPFKTIQEYTDFAKNLDIISFPDKKQHKKAVDIISKGSKFQFDLNSSVTHMKRFVIESAWESFGSYSVKKEKTDPIVSAISSLSHLELLILILAFKYCKVRDLDSLPCNALVSEAGKFSGRAKISRQVVFQLIQNLLSYGLFLKVTHSKTSCNFINDWTMVSVTVREEDLRNALNRIQSTLPVSLQAQINLN